MYDEKQYLLDKYTLHIRELKQYNVWTFEQMKRFLHLDFSTIQSFVTYKILYKFNVSRCTFYSTKKTTFTNQAIIKSILEIDSVFRLNYVDIENFVPDDKLYSKKLIAKGVNKIGYINNKYKPIYYNVLFVKPLLKTEYEKIAKILLDIRLENNESDYSIVTFMVHDVEDVVELNDFLNNHPQLLLLFNLQYLTVQIVDCKYSHFKYLTI